MNQTTPKRECGGCTLCCKLVPVPQLGKLANERCRYQRTGKGCAIYASRPLSCRAWSCAWLTGPHTESLRRPDRAHYVVDCMLDTVAQEQPGGGYAETPVVQIWADPGYPDDVINDLELRAWLERLNMPALVRYGNDEPGVMMAPPARTNDGEWMIRRSGLVSNERKEAILAGAPVTPDEHAASRPCAPHGAELYSSSDSNGPSRTGP